MELIRQRLRFSWVGVLLVLAFLALGFRLVDLQWVRHEEFLNRARRIHFLQIPLKGHRGDILDRRGEILARSFPAQTLCADPGLIGDYYPVVARVLAGWLNTNEIRLAELLRPRVRTNEAGDMEFNRHGQPQTNRYVRIRRRVTDEDWARISEALSRETFGLSSNRMAEIRVLRKSVFASRDEDEIRVYPNKQLAASVLGFTDADGVGLEGLEWFLNDQLKGVDGCIRTGRTLRGMELRWMRELEMEPEHGRDVYLTLDATLQMIVEEELAETVRKYQAAGGCVVVVQPRTGRILAMANSPTFDPNQPPLGEMNPLTRRNWGVSHTFEPGSCFKIVVATGVLNEGLVGLKDLVDCGEAGYLVRQYGREKVELRDDHPMKERWSPVERVIAHSSNIGSFHLALRLGRERYADYLRRFGFYEETGVRMPQEERGLLRPVSQWSMTDFSRISIGYSVAVTPLQLAMAMSVLANDGRLMRPQIIDRIVAQDGTVLAQPPPEMVRQVCRPEAAAKVREALRLVVDDGTGSLVKMDRYTVAGKTGTAKLVPYRLKRYRASFAGFFPSESPELCIAVVIEDPNRRLGYYGGRVAGGTFRNIAERAADYLGVLPDVPLVGEDPELLRTTVTSNGWAPGN